MVDIKTRNRQVKEAENFLADNFLSIENYPNFNFNEISSMLDSYQSSESVKRLIPTGLKRLFVEFRTGETCLLDKEDLAEKVNSLIITTEDDSDDSVDDFRYNDLITAIFPTPFKDENVEGFPKECAYIGHYLTVDMVASQFKKLLGKGQFDFVLLFLYLKKFFNAIPQTEDFSVDNVMRIAFRICYVGGKYNRDLDSGEDSEEQFYFVAFSDGLDLLKSKLRKMAKKRKENYKQFQSDPLIKWILPIFPFYDYFWFSKQEKQRKGFYCWFREFKQAEDIEQED